MIEEVDTLQYVNHYFEKAYKELDHSPEAFVRHALEFVQKEAGLLTQPGALRSLTRLAEDVALNSGDGAPLTSIETMSIPPPLPAVGTSTKSPATDSDARQPTPSTSEMVDVQNEGNEEDSGETSHKIKPNNGNGADLSTYSWTQTLADIALNVPLPPGTKGKMCDITITRNKLKIGLKNAPPILDGNLYAPVVADDCIWNVLDGKVLEITLQKADTMQWWKSIIQGEPEIDTQDVEPESSKLSDLDPGMRATVEKMMYDQRQKAMGLPTSDESQREQIMKNFMKAHPEMDFSGAKMNF